MTGITNPTEEYFKDGCWGWDGSRWRKLSLLFGYSGPYNEVTSNTNVSAGISDLAGSTVPAGEIWIVQGMLAAVISTTCSEFRFDFWNGTGQIICKQVLTPTSGQFYDYQGTLILAAGYYPLIRMYGMTAGDDAYLYAWGYKMKVT